MEVVNRTRTRGTHTLSKDAFFNAVAAQAGYLPRDVVEKVYWAIVRTTVAELKRHGRLKMPDFGDFTLRYMRARKARLLVSKGVQKDGFLPERRIIRYDADYKLKAYFRMLDGGREIRTSTGKEVLWRLPR